MDRKISIDLGAIQETLLLPLWGRAVESQKQHPKLADNKAVEILGAIDYDFSTIAGNISWITQYAWVARCLHVDAAIREFCTTHPRGSIVNIGCGLDTTFDRIDNGTITFYDLDLPDVISLRMKFFQETERHPMIAQSFLDEQWFDRIGKEHSVLFIAAGVFYYFREPEIRQFILSLCRCFPGSEMFFDIASPMGVRVANKKVIRDGGMDATAMLQWGIGSPGDIERWDPHIRVSDAYPLFKGMKKGFSAKAKYALWMSDVLRIMSMLHVKILS